MKTKRKKLPELTHDQMIALGECAHLFVLLSESTTPHAKELAMIVAARMKAIVAEGAAARDVPDEATLELLLSIEVPK